MRDTLKTLIADTLAPLAEEWQTTITAESIELPAPPDPSMGDYAVTLAMRLAKAARQAPIKIAGRMAALLAAREDWFSRVEAASPGYVNLTLSSAAIARMLEARDAAGAAALRHAGVPRTVVVDYSGVNIAKQMHVGHLRTTIIGDALARVLAARGERVIRQNHLGDWGLPIAMVLWKAQPRIHELEAQGAALSGALTLADLEALYREAALACKTEAGAAETCRHLLVLLQNGDAQLRADWQKITRLSMDEVYRVYELMDVTLVQDDERGESFYHDLLSATVADIQASGHLEESQGAQCVFPDGFVTKDGSPLPVIVQKSDGGYNYATFDLAAVRHCVEALHADAIIYVTDARQSLHFAQIFAVAGLCGWLSRDGAPVVLEHVAFGSVLGEDNTPLKTRSGENVKLAELLAEALERAYAVVTEKNPALPEEKKRAVARAVGIGAVKYADLAHDRNNDYVFAWERMLALNGNTAPYLQYAHARICSIFRKAGVDEATLRGPFVLEHAAERALAGKLLELPEAVARVAETLRPHILCNYLYELAAAFSSFYDNCPVINADTPTLRASRLYLCHLSRRTLATGLDLLGITAPEEM